MALQTKAIWTEKMAFRAEAAGNQIIMDAKSPIGEGRGMTPKELVALAISGCTGMDVCGLLRKYKQPLESFSVEAHVTTTEGVVPMVFQRVDLTFILTGALDQDKVLQAIHLSQTQYCGVSAMMVKACPIHYKVLLNGAEIGSGQAQF